MADTASHTQSAPTNKFQSRPFVFTLILLAAFGLRGCAVLFQPETPIADAADYHQLGMALADGHGYVNGGGKPTAWRPPGYPVFLSFIYRITGPSVLAATLIQSLLGALTVLVLMLFASTILSYTETVIAGVVAAIYPGLEIGRAHV